MNRNRLSKNLIANILSYAIATALSFIITPFIVNNLGKEIYGFYGIANNVVSYITVIAVALNSMAAKYITVEIVRGNDLKAKQYYSSVFFSNICLCTVLLPILIGIVCNIGSFLQVSNEYYQDVQILFLLVFAAMLLRFSTAVFGSATYATNRMDLSAYIDISKSFLRLILYVILFVLFRPSIIYLGCVLFLLELFNSIIQIILAKKLLPNMAIKKRYFNLKLIWEMLRVGIWNSLNQLGDLMLSSSDLIMANILIGEGASGIISIIKTMPTLISGVITAINAVFMPRVAYEYAKNNTKALTREIKQAQKIMGAIVTPIVMLLIIFGKNFYNLWVPGNDIKLLAELSAIDVSRMMLIAVVWPVSNLNIVLDKVKIPSLLVILSGVMNILTMIFLTKTTNIGVFAIVVTTLFLTIMFYGIFIPMYPCKFLNLSYTSFIGPIGQMIIAAILIGCILIPLHNAIVIKNWIDFIIKGGLCAVPAFVLSIIVFVGPYKIINVLNKRRK